MAHSVGAEWGEHTVLLPICLKDKLHVQSTVRSKAEACPGSCYPNVGSCSTAVSQQERKEALLGLDIESLTFLGRRHFIPGHTPGEF